MLALGLALELRRLVLVPQIVVGATPGSPVGTVTDERDVSLMLPYGGLTLSIEPWIRPRR